MGCYDTPSICIFVHLPPISPTTIYSRCCFLFYTVRYFIVLSRSNQSGFKCWWHVYFNIYECFNFFLTMIKPLIQKKTLFQIYFQYTVLQMANSCTYTAQIVWSNLLNSPYHCKSTQTENTCGSSRTPLSMYVQIGCEMKTVCIDVIQLVGLGLTPVSVINSVETDSIVFILEWALFLLKF